MGYAGTELARGGAGDHTPRFGPIASNPAFCSSLRSASKSSSASLTPFTACSIVSSRAFAAVRRGCGVAPGRGGQGPGGFMGGRGGFLGTSRRGRGGGGGGVGGGGCAPGRRC